MTSAARPAPGAAGAAPASRTVHVRAEVLSRKKVGRYHHLTLVAPGVAERHRPGTFVAVSVGGPDSARLARRAFWVLRARPAGAYGGTVELLVAERGPGTRWLTTLAPGSVVPLTGPLGRPFALPKEPVACTLVGHGEGVAALQSLAERLKERGCTVHVVLAAADEAGLYGALEARRAARTVQVVTEDGSVGLRGRLPDLLPGLLDAQAPDVVYAAGPTAVLHAAAVAAEQRGAWSQVALTGPMPCAIGHCLGCAVPVVGEDAVARTVRACVDGPVLRGDRVRWDAWGDPA